VEVSNIYVSIITRITFLQQLEKKYINNEFNKESLNGHIFLKKQLVAEGSDGGYA
jgi:hypothetical protein